ncbi:MAG: hypothetical protein H0U53_01385 [Actinobacteria bacterium]|nr:hypothetical protein [Actinomycetota bacterium]
MRFEAQRSLFRALVVAVAVAIVTLLTPISANAAEKAPKPKPHDGGPSVLEESDTGTVIQAHQGCITTANTPTLQFNAIVGTLEIDCNVAVTDVWFYGCMQVSPDDQTWWNQDGTCGWRFSTDGPTAYADATLQWNCIGSNPWYYRTSGYSEKRFPNGQVSLSPWKYSPSWFALC